MNRSCLSSFNIHDTSETGIVRALYRYNADAKYALERFDFKEAHRILTYTAQLCSQLLKEQP